MEEGTAADLRPAGLAFVSHEACARHDPGWIHPDHQGRLRAVVRAVYADLPVLHTHLLEVEGRLARVDELTRVHDPDYLESVRAAAQDAGRTAQPFGGSGRVMISGATWDAVLGASGSAITAAETVIEGRARTSFACIRPPGRDALRSSPGGFSLVNHAAVVGAHIRAAHGLNVLILDWAPGGSPGAASIFQGEAGVTVRHVDTAAGDADGVTDALRETLSSLTGSEAPAIIVLSAGFDMLESDPTSNASHATESIGVWTEEVRRFADEWCGGRVVSLLEGGYDAKATGAAVVAHLRALIGLGKEEI